MKMQKGIFLSLLLVTLVVSTGRASSVETITIQSEKMGREIPATLILPDAYQKGAARYPVLYLLHGAGDTNRKWVDKTEVELLADAYGVIIVCPDGGGPAGILTVLLIRPASMKHLWPKSVLPTWIKTTEPMPNAVPEPFVETAWEAMVPCFWPFVTGMFSALQCRSVAGWISVRIQIVGI